MKWSWLYVYPYEMGIMVEGGNSEEINKLVVEQIEDGWLFRDKANSTLNNQRLYLLFDKFNLIPEYKEVV